MNEEIQEVTDREEYWATEQDLDKFVGDLITRKEDFYRFIDSSNLFKRISRNWRYYHNLYHDDNLGQSMEIKFAGEEGEYSLIAINHFRAYLRLIITYVTQNRPAWDTRAINSDHRSMQQARLANDILDFYMEDKGVEKVLEQCVEDALIFTTGYIKITWNEDMGRELRPDESGQILREGDIEFENPNIFDVVFDQTITDWRKVPWVTIRKHYNKWDLISRFPDMKTEILQADPYDRRDDDFHRFDRVGVRSDKSDMVDVWEFYHKATPSVPDGRYVLYIGDKPLMEDSWLEDIPLVRLVPSEFMLTPFGYTPAFDLQGIQEATNSEHSTIVTNHKNLGPTKIWIKTGEIINQADLEPGVNAIQTDTKPEPIQLCQTPKEFFKYMEVLANDGQIISGMNAAALGQPPASLESGYAVALVEQKAIQSQSSFNRGYYDALGEMGTKMIKLLKTKPVSKRLISISGINNRSELKEFLADDIANVDRVVVQPGNPLSRFTAGRAAMAEHMLERGLIKTPQEYLTVLETGQLKPLVDTTDSQLNVIHDENDRLKNGESVVAYITDDQQLHVLKHAAILDSVEMRSDPIVAPNVQSHILQHLELMMDLAYQEYAAVFGFQAPLPPAMMNPMNNAPGGQPNPMTPPKALTESRPGGGLPSAAQANLESAAMNAMPQR